jgi:muramoyltetrapeptide carboxypeptidase
MSRIIQPQFLKSGDAIGITCPSGYLPKERVVAAQQHLESKGYRVVLGKTIGSEYFYFSDTDERRLADLQALLDDVSIKAIIMGRGGYGLSRIIDRLDFSTFVQHPKWICGFSDITVLHSYIHQQFGIATLHSPMCGAFTSNAEQPIDVSGLLSMLIGTSIAYPVPMQEWNREGEAEGVLVGGNLAILAHLSGSNAQLDTRGKILFIEDVGEYLYNTDRMLLNLQRSGQLEHLAGLICGGFTEMKDTDRPFGQTIYQILYSKVAAYQYPVIFDFPSGHIGATYTLKVNHKEHATVALQQPFDV